MKLARPKRGAVSRGGPHKHPRLKG